MTLSAEDRLLIHELYARYSHAYDMGTADEWIECFTSDGAFEIFGEVSSGHEGLLRFITARKASGPQARHFPANIVLEESGDGVAGRCYVAVYRIDPKPTNLLTTAQYDNDRIVKTPQGWKFASRRVIME